MLDQGPNPDRELLNYFLTRIINFDERFARTLQDQITHSFQIRISALHSSISDLVGCCRFSVKVDSKLVTYCLRLLSFLLRRILPANFVVYINLFARTVGEKHNNLIVLIKVGAVSDF